jgi:hypothetical protein
MSACDRSREDSLTYLCRRALSSGPVLSISRGSFLELSGSNMENVCRTATARSTISLACDLSTFPFTWARSSRSKNFGEMLSHNDCNNAEFLTSCCSLSRTDLRRASPTNLDVSSFATRRSFIFWSVALASTSPAGLEVEGTAFRNVSVISRTPSLFGYQSFGF